MERHAKRGLLRIGLLQFDQVFERPDENRARIHGFLAERSGLDLCVLPEMSLTGFSMDRSITELPVEEHRWFSELAREFSMGIVYCAVENGRNVAILLDREGRRIGRYAKRHLFGLGGESGSYVAGEVREIWTFEGWRILPAICYDLRFSYHFWESAGEIDLVVVPANWPASRSAQWKTLLSARAIENQVFVAGCNRIGNDPQLSYSGNSLVVDPTGRILSDGADRSGIVRAELNLDELNNARARFPFLADRLDGSTR